MAIYIVGQDIDNSGIEDRLGTNTTPENSIQGKLANLILLYGTRTEAAGITNKGILPRLSAIADGIEKLRATVASPINSETAYLAVDPDGTLLVRDAPSYVMTRLITIQVESGSPISLFNGYSVSGTPRLKNIPAGVVHTLNHRGALFATTESGSALCNITLDY